jgi:hypothetical protein
MEDAVGLMDAPVHGKAQDHALGSGFESLDPEELMDVVRVEARRKRGGRRHRRRLSARR